MTDRTARTAEIGRAIVHEARVEKLTFMAGSIAYHAFLSILPLLLLVLILVERTQNIAVQESVVGIMEAVLTPQSSQLLQQGLSDADASVSVLGVAFLVWGALRIFRGLDTAFSDIYETGANNSFTDQIRDGLVMLGTVALAILSVSLVNDLISVSVGGALGTLLRGAATSVGLFVVFYPMYYIFPDTDVSVLEVVPGTAFAAVGLTVAQALFTAFKTGGTGSNLVASILVLLTWLYIIGLVVLLGATINAVLSNRSRDVDISPVFGGIEQQGPGASHISRAQLLEELQGLSVGLADAESVTVTVDGESVTVVGPQSAAVDHETSVLGLDDSVVLTLRWWPDEE